MSVSIYYSATRPRPLTDDERAAIDALIAASTVELTLKQRARTGRGHNWESFCVYDPSAPSSPNVVFEGATKLPDNSAKAMWQGVQHWTALLSGIRRVLPTAAWDVHVDDHYLEWDDASQQYNLTE